MSTKTKEAIETAKSLRESALQKTKDKLMEEIGSGITDQYINKLLESDEFDDEDEEFALGKPALEDMDFELPEGAEDLDEDAEVEGAEGGCPLAEDEDIDLDLEGLAEDEDIDGTGVAEGEEEIKLDDEDEEEEIKEGADAETLTEFDRYGGGSFSNENELIMAINKLAEKGEQKWQQIKQFLNGKETAKEGAYRKSALKFKKDALAETTKSKQYATKLKEAQIKNAKLIALNKITKMQLQEKSHNASVKLIRESANVNEVKKSLKIVESLAKKFTGGSRSKSNAKRMSSINEKVNSVNGTEARRKRLVENAEKNHNSVENSEMRRMQELAGIDVK